MFYLFKANPQILNSSSITDNIFKDRLADFTVLIKPEDNADTAAKT